MPQITETIIAAAGAATRRTVVVATLAVIRMAGVEEEAELDGRVQV